MLYVLLLIPPICSATPPTSSLFPYTTLFRSFQVECTPCQPSSKRGENQLVTLFPLILPVRQTERNGRSSRITILVYIDHHFICAPAHSPGSGMDNSPVCLMRNQPGNIIPCQLVTLHKFQRYISHPFRRFLEYGPSVLPDRVISVPDSFFGCRIQTPSGGLIEHTLFIAIGIVNIINYFTRIPGFQNHGTRYRKSTRLNSS